MRTLIVALTVSCSVPLACSDFEPRSSTVSAEHAASPSRQGTVSGSTPVFQPTVEKLEADSYAIGSAHLFAVNDAAASLSILALAAPPAKAAPPRNVMLPPGRRVLNASLERDFAVALMPGRQTLVLVCADGRLSSLTLPHPADSSAIHTTGDVTRVLAYDSSGAKATTSLSVIAVTGCTATQKDVSTLEVGSSPHQVLLGASAAYVHSLQGLIRLDLAADVPTAAPFSEEPGSVLELSKTAAGDFLVMQVGQRLLVVDGDSGEQVELASTELAPRAGGGGEGGAGAVGGELTAGEGGASGAQGEFANARVVAGSQGRFVLVAAAGQLARYGLPTSGNPEERMPFTSTSIELGATNDCGVAYTPGDNSLTKLELSPFAASAIALTREIKSAELFCKPARGATPESCCNGIAVVSHVLEPLSPLGQTEAYSVVDLATLASEVRLSSLPVQGMAAFDAGNAVLVALGSATSASRQLRLFTPFETGGLDNQRRIDLTDAANHVGSVSAGGAIGYVGLTRRDGGVLFVARAGQAAISPSSYEIFRQLDFRLTERVNPNAATQKVVP